MALHLEVTEHVVPLRTPLRSGWGTLDRRTLFVVTLSDRGADGPVGRGEAAPLEAYDGMTDQTCRAALADLARRLPGLDADSPGHELLAQLQDGCDCAHALAAVDLALWDRAGRAANQPVAKLIDGAASSSVQIQALLGGDPEEVITERAAALSADGFTAFKIKVAAGAEPGSAAAIERDVRRVAALREAVGPAARIKVDANGAWTVAQAVEALRRLTAPPLLIAAAEEPVSGGDQWAHLRAAVNAAGIDVDLSIDETADREPGALRRGADTVELKLSRTGGIGPLLVQAAVVGLAGVRPSLASAFDGPLGIAAAVHVGAALQLDRPLGLGTLAAMDFSATPELAELAQRLEPSGGRIAVPAGPGLI